MKTNRYLIFQSLWDSPFFFPALKNTREVLAGAFHSAVLAGCAIAVWSLASPVFADAAPAAKSDQEFPRIVQFELGDKEFAPGDSITIRELRGTSDAITTGERYCVTGSYTLGSQDQADLSFFATTTNLNPTPIDPDQTVRIKKGFGTFRLIKTMTGNGYLHLTFYSRSSGDGFGRFYFGQDPWVLRDKHFGKSGRTTSNSGFRVHQSGADESHAIRLTKR